MHVKDELTLPSLPLTPRAQGVVMTRTIAFRRVWSGLLLGAAQLSLLAAAADATTSRRRAPTTLPERSRLRLPRSSSPRPPSSRRTRRSPSTRPSWGARRSPRTTPPRPAPGRGRRRGAAAASGAGRCLDPGYWWWSRHLARYVWIGGAWRNAPPDQVWTPGSWVQFASGRYGWSPGYWAPRGFVRDAAFIETAPPPFRVESY